MIPEIVLTEHEGEVHLPVIVRGGEVVEDDGNPSEEVEVADDDGIGAFERAGAAAAGSTSGTGGGHGREGGAAARGETSRQGRWRRDWYQFNNLACTHNDSTNLVTEPCPLFP